MADADNENDLFAIDFSDEASSEAEKQEKVPRNFQSQAEFEKVKEEYRAKVENGEVRSTTFLGLAAIAFCFHSGIATNDTYSCIRPSPCQ